jgi:hypothetical protein
MKMASLVAWLVLLAVSSGCSASTAQEDRAAALASMVKEAVREGAGVLRCNPVECSCPPMELRVADRWIRVDLTDSSVAELTPEGIVALCRSETGPGTPQSHHWAVDLRSSSARWCANGTPYYELSLKSLSVETPEP